jgi:hypothetical protein
MPEPKRLEVTIFAAYLAELLMQPEAQIAPSRPENNALGHRIFCFDIRPLNSWLPEYYAKHT